MNRDQVISQVIRYLKAGEREKARRLLGQLLRAAPHDAQAWLLMSQAVSDETRRRECLARAHALTHHPPPTPRSQISGSSLPSRDDPPYYEPIAREQPLSGVLDGDLIDMDIATRRKADHPTPHDHERRQGYRNIMIATALTFSLLCGLALLITTAFTVVPQAQARRLTPPTPEPVLYMATLWCPPCAQAGSPVILWEKVGDGISRGGKVGELPHNTRVAVLAEVWSAPEQRTYYKVAAHGQKGWVPETFIKDAPPR